MNILLFLSFDSGISPINELTSSGFENGPGGIWFLKNSRSFSFRFSRCRFMISFSVKPFFCDLAIFSLHLNFNSFILIASVQNLQKTTLAFLSTKSLDLLRITFCDVDSRFFSLEFQFVIEEPYIPFFTNVMCR